MFEKNFSWVNTNQISSKEYICCYCDNKVAADVGYFHSDRKKIIYICPHSECHLPTFFFLDNEPDEEFQIPAPPIGESIKHLPPDVETLYNEARACTTVEAYTSAVMLCRKLLMHIAVDKGADTEKSFWDYVNWLDEENYIPPNGKDWVDFIRKKGNDINHKIQIMKKADAEKLIVFVGMLMKFAYEFSSLDLQLGSDS